MLSRRRRPPLSVDQGLSVGEGHPGVGSPHAILSTVREPLKSGESADLTTSSTTADSAGAPSGTLTFVFTDIEGSSRRWEQRPDQMREALRLHDELLREALVGHGGYVFKHTGDGFAVVFTRVSAAIEAMVTGQAALQRADWPGGDRLKVRMGAHVGEVAPHDGDYFGSTVNRSARIADVANGDQIVVSLQVSALATEQAFAGQGNHQLRGIGSAELFLVVDGRMEVDDRPLRTRVGARPGAVPIPPSAIIARDREMVQLAAMVRDHRMVSLVGPAGVGKTHLSTAMATQPIAGFSDLPVYCSLASVPTLPGNDVSDEALEAQRPAVVEALATALGARQQPDSTLEESVMLFCEGRSFLLVLDSCEHAIEVCRSLLHAMVKRPGPSVLAVSRRPLGIVGEQRVPLAPLEPSTAGVELFVARATARDPGFVASSADLETVGEICRRLDGIPLAIELAAARARVLDPQQLLARLDDRFRVLRAGSGGTTMAEALGWSTALLEPPTAAVFDRLSVFRGGFALESVEAVCGDLTDEDMLDVVMRLVDASLVDSDRGAGQVRFRMLETVRDYARLRLDESGDAAAAQERHAAWAHSLVESVSADLMTHKEPDVWAVLGKEWDNIEAAFVFSMSHGRLDDACDIVAALAWYSMFAMRFETFRWAKSLVDELRAVGHCRLAELEATAAIGGYFMADQSAEEEATALIDQRTLGGAIARATLAAIALNNRLDLDSSDVHTAALIDLLDNDEIDLGDDAPLRFWALGLRGFYASLVPDPARPELVAALTAKARHSESASALALAKWAEGLALMAAGEPEQADIAWRRGLDAARSLGRDHLLVHLVNGLRLHWAAPDGDLVDTIAQCREALSEAVAADYMAGASHLFGVTAILLARAGDVDNAAALLGVMKAHGHRPRPPAPQIVAAAIDGSAGTSEAAASDGAELSVKAAGQLAERALLAAAAGASA